METYHIPIHMTAKDSASARRLHESQKQRHALGLEIARALAEAGAHAVINGRTAATLEGAVSQIASAGGSAENDATAFKAASSQNE